MKHFNVWSLPKSDQWNYYCNPTWIKAIRINGPFSVETVEGVLVCQDGWLALDANDNPFPIDAETFDRTYEKIGGIDLP